MTAREHRFKPTYKELKPYKVAYTALRVVRFKPTYKELKR